MATKGYSAFPKAPVSLETDRTLWSGGGVYTSAEVQSVYATAPVDLAISSKVEQIKSIGVKYITWLTLLLLICFSRSPNIHPTIKKITGRPKQLIAHKKNHHPTNKTICIIINNRQTFSLYHNSSMLLTTWTLQGWIETHLPLHETWHLTA